MLDDNSVTLTKVTVTETAQLVGRLRRKPKSLLVPYPADQMRMWEISPRVKSPKNDDPSLLEPIHAQPTQTITDALELLRE
jgi:hypothetical protein